MDFDADSRMRELEQGRTLEELAAMVAQLEARHIDRHNEIAHLTAELTKVRDALRTASTIDALSGRTIAAMLEHLPVGFALAHSYYFDHNCVQEWAVIPLHALALDQAIAQGRTPAEAMEAAAYYLASWERRVKAAQARLATAIEETCCGGGCSCETCIPDSGEKTAG